MIRSYYVIAPHQRCDLFSSGSTTDLGPTFGTVGRSTVNSGTLMIHIRSYYVITPHRRCDLFSSGSHCRSWT